MGWGMAGAFHCGLVGTEGLCVTLHVGYFVFNECNCF